MGNYDITREKESVRIDVRAGTRAGLLIAALQGLTTAEGAMREPGADVQDRAFSVEAADFTAVFTAFLQQAMDVAASNKEVYEDVRFDLITDKKATGAFAGHPAPAHVRTFQKIVPGSLKIEKKDVGWEAVFTIR